MAALPNVLLSSDTDSQETREWLDALEGVIEQEGPERAHFLIETADRDRAPTRRQPALQRRNRVHQHDPGGSAGASSRATSRSSTRIRSLRALERDGDGAAGEQGQPTSAATSPASPPAATLYDVGFNHFWHAPSEKHGGDLVFVQGHSAPGIYARAFMLGRLTEEQLDNFRQEVDGKGLSSYPHPWLMPDFWQFPTVSMGLGPIMAIYQARFMKYLQDRG